MLVNKEINEAFKDYIFDWDYKTYLSLGGYGSSKSYHTALKLILKLFAEKRKALVVREVYDTLKESTFDLIFEILDSMDMLEEESNKGRTTKVRFRVSPLQFVFPNGSRIIFKGMDSPSKVKSINNVSIVWIEEASELKYAGYKELLGRVRCYGMSLHFILTTNPVGMETWVYTHFFKSVNELGEETIVLDDKDLYNKKVIVCNNTYYHHSTVDDNKFINPEYIQTLDELRTYDDTLWRIARWGRFGVNGLRVLPQFTVAKNPTQFVNAIRKLPISSHYFGMDFGFETSYNAVISCAVDIQTKTLYIYDEIYINNITDDVMSEHPKMVKHKIMEHELVADNEDPKAISFYRRCGYKMRGCRNKFAGSRLSNTRKLKRFKRIVCSPTCVNVIRELKSLTYKINRQGKLIYDEFNIDPHTFSALWYALDNVTVADVKHEKRNNKRG